MKNAQTYLESALHQFKYYRSVAEKTFAQLTDEQLFWQYNAESNSVAMIVQHISGNMLSRWTDFLTSDGEKEWRNREAEFDTVIKNRDEMIAEWDKGWQCLFDAINPLTDDDLNKIVLIRAETHSVAEAINRQLAHYPYHIGQIVFIGKMLAGDQWKSMTIPRGKSQAFNDKMFGR
ncbi:DUF1572 family protein [Mucilaginibacter ginsenosidivorans]|uniref:DUF1572 domain-containing protein n=1 Tax=Mucilaginibacter ginsenosidivorans TaxID=398053 RepID=A0A5B8UZC8_9SPHI|nr:DUF1572 family protein [Mucilaginibacter ginsenosidivorans]QEC64567.1 DUF1572 domain-containing protein [Mucilaginibacter ginsenosidivorans]